MINTQMSSCGTGVDTGLFAADGLSTDLVDAAGLLGGAAFSLDENPFLFPLDLMGFAAGFQAAESAENLNGVLDDSVLDDSASADVSDETTFRSPDSTVDTTPAWWLLHTKPRQEKKLATQLAWFEVPHYLPVVKRRAVTRGRTRVTMSPLFPGYFFLRGTPEQRLRALETNRIVAAHRVGDGEGLRARLWELADLIEKGAPLTAEARLATGSRVRVKSGLFQNMEGTVIERGGKTRLFIAINQLLGGVSMEIEEHLLEPLF